MKAIYSLIILFLLSSCVQTTKILTVDEHLSHINYENKLSKDGSFYKKLDGDTQSLFIKNSHDTVDRLFALGYNPRYWFATADESKETIDLGFLINTAEWRFWDRAADTTHGIDFDFYQGSRETHSGSSDVCWEQFILTMSTEDAIKVADSYTEGDHGPWWITIAGERWPEIEVGVSVNYLKAFLVKLGKR